MIAREPVERVSVPVRSKLRTRVKAHPEELGFPAGASEASILADLVKSGARVRAEQQRRAERLRLYEEWADDAEPREAVQSAYEEGRGRWPDLAVTIRRGTIHAYVRPGATVPVVGLLVLTNDDWNDRMSSIGGVLIRPEAEVEATPLHPVVAQSPRPIRAIADKLFSSHRSKRSRARSRSHSPANAGATAAIS